MLWFLALSAAFFQQSCGQDVVQPKLVVPGEWLTDKDEKFLFLPLEVPAGLPLDQIKIMANGDTVLVVVTEKPEEKPDSKAMTKYKMLVEALKEECGHDEAKLKEKLQIWYDTEDDDEVRVHVRAALDSLSKVRAAKANNETRTFSVPLGLLSGSSFHVGSSFLARTESHNASAVIIKSLDVVQAARALPSLHAVSSMGMKVGIIKESFALEVPFPVPTKQIFILDTGKDELIVSMPLKRNSMEAKGISTGGKPFQTVPVFNIIGQLLDGPEAHLGNLAPGMDVLDVAAKEGLKPLP